MFNMRKYKVTLEGRNFLLARAEGQGKHGFYTIRFVEAADGQGAEAAAVEQLRARPGLREMTLNEREDPPTMYVAGVEELASFEGLKSLDQGLIWFPEDKGG